MVESKKTKKRVVLMGLDAAGKSSILLSLQSDTRLSSYLALAPTLDIGRGVVTDDQTEFFIFDFGGQETLRRDYLENLGKHLGDVDKVIFVIDIKDTQRHTIAIDYLSRIVLYLAANPKQIPKQEPHYVPVSVFFHKYDLLPGGKEDRALELVARGLAEGISRVIPSCIPYEIHHTSIYVQFQKTKVK
jgi:small GTP-binding protein